MSLPRMKKSRLLAGGVAVIAALVLGASPAFAAPTAKTGVCPPGLTKHATLTPDQARGLDLTGCDTDATVVADGVGVELPEPGNGMAAFGVTTDGAEASLTVTTDEDGIVHVDVDGYAATTDTTATAAITRCTDTSRALMGAKWYTAPTFQINAAERRPSNVSASRWNSIVTTALTTLKSGRNSCGLAPIHAPGRVLTGSTADSQITTSNTCAAPNTTSSVDFGSLSGGMLGLTCVAFRAHDGYDAIAASDIRIDNSSRSWVFTPTGCTGARFDLLATTSHEMGHAFGLNHAAERGGNDLMMSPVITSCNASARTLGRGDLIGMVTLYPR